MKLFPLKSKKRGWAVGTLGVVLVSAFAWTLLNGAVETRPSDLFRALFGTGGQSVAEIVIREIRLPRAVLALLCGAVLAAAGCALQALFRNPLADPGLIGVSAGGAVGAAMAISLGAVLAGVLPGMIALYSTMLGAGLGAVGATTLIYFLARTPAGPSVAAMLLCGIALNTFAGALMGLFVFFSEAERIRDLAFWTLGSLARAPAATVWAGLPVMLLALVVLFRQARALNIILLGEEDARVLGINTRALKQRVFLAAGVGVGTAVALCGTIGFVGLVVPHICRIIFGTDHRWLLPLSAACGGGALLVADAAARAVSGTAELPIGIVTALIGGPFFLALLIYERKRLYLPL